LRTGEGTSGERLTDLGEAPLALGQLTYGTSVRELTSAYTALAGDGTFKAGRTYLAVYDRRGELLLGNERREIRAFRETTASIMTKQLERVVNGGTANGVRLPGGIPVAGKTGTSSAGRDKWFVGYTPYYLCGVWCGSVAETVAVAGKPQLAVFNSIMGRIHASISKGEAPIREFSLADGVYEGHFCRDGGGLLTVDCLCDPRGDRSAVGWFTAETLPKTPCHCHIGVLCGEGGGVYSELNGELLSPLGERPLGLRRVGLLRAPERTFPVQIYVKDAQYVYRPLLGEMPAEDSFVPYFLHTLPKGTYAGISKTEDGTQFNAPYLGCHREEEDPFSFYSHFFG
jgi:penicillin-binding protein 1A